MSNWKDRMIDTKWLNGTEAPYRLHALARTFVDEWLQADHVDLTSTYKLGMADPELPKDDIEFYINPDDQWLCFERDKWQDFVKQYCSTNFQPLVNDYSRIIELQGMVFFLPLACLTWEQRNKKIVSIKRHYGYADIYGEDVEIRNFFEAILNSHEALKERENLATQLVNEAK